MKAENPWEAAESVRNDEVCVSECVKKIRAEDVHGVGGLSLDEVVGGKARQEFLARSAGRAELFDFVVHRWPVVKLLGCFS